jgi:DNA-binding NtrC family response regulator
MCNYAFLPNPETERRPRLLLVDDEPDILDFFERALRHAYEVHRFNDPVAALATLRALAFDLVVTDQWMPLLSGLELLAEAAGLQPHTVRILISGFADAPQLKQAIAARQIHHFVLKPITSRQLLEAIATATERARP